ncbi:MAG: type I restriction enzyme endonuclease domain-containing protein [Actinomycetota bacterium]
MPPPSPSTSPPRNVKDGLLRQVPRDRCRLQPGEGSGNRRGDFQESCWARGRSRWEEERAVREGLSEDELAVFDLLLKDDLSKAQREQVKEASQQLLESVVMTLRRMTDWTKTETTQAAVRVLILDSLWQTIPQPPYTGEDIEPIAASIFGLIWERSSSGDLAA